MDCRHLGKCQVADIENGYSDEVVEIDVSEVAYIVNFWIEILVEEFLEGGFLNFSEIYPFFLEFFNFGLQNFDFQHFGHSIR